MIAFIFDTETSGLIENRSIKLDKQPEIIEFYGALVDLTTGEIKAEIDELFKPTKRIEEIITKITTLTNDDLADKPPFSTHAMRIKSTLEEAPLVIAHNLSFDQEMVEIEMERLKKTIIWPAMLCTVEATLHLKGFRLKLSALHEYLFGQPFDGAHRARVDVDALIRCCVELVKRDEL